MAVRACHIAFILFGGVAAVDEWQQFDMYHIYPMNKTDVGIGNMWLGDIGQAAYYSIRSWFGHQMCEQGKGNWWVSIGNNTELGAGGCAFVKETTPLESYVFEHVKVKVLMPFAEYSTCAYSWQEDAFVCSCGESFPMNPCPQGTIGPDNSSHVGKGAAHGMYPVGGWPFDLWHIELGRKMLNYSWYNTPAVGECLGEKTPDCTWQVQEYVSTTQSSCHLDAVIEAAEKRAPVCFRKCVDRYDSCWNHCMFGHVLRFMSGAEISELWAVGFAACPNIKQQPVIA